jgi:hypothetical protein
MRIKHKTRRKQQSGGNESTEIILYAAMDLEPTEFDTAYPNLTEIFTKKYGPSVFRDRDIRKDFYSLKDDGYKFCRDLTYINDIISPIIEFYNTELDKDTALVKLIETLKDKFNLIHMPVKGRYDPSKIDFTNEKIKHIITNFKTILFNIFLAVPLEKYSLHKYCRIQGSPFGVKMISQNLPETMENIGKILDSNAEEEKVNAVIEDPTEVNREESSAGGNKKKHLKKSRRRLIKKSKTRKSKTRQTRK